MAVIGLDRLLQETLKEGIEPSARIPPEFQEKETNCVTTNTLIRFADYRQLDIHEFIRPVVKPEGPYNIAYLLDTGNWILHDYTKKLFVRLNDMLDDPRGTFDAGRYSYKLRTLGFISVLARLLGGPGVAYQNCEKYSWKFNKVYRMTPEEVLRNHAVIRVKYFDRFVPTREGCDYTQGILAMVPTGWGMPEASISELQCQADGADSCRFEIEYSEKQTFFNKLFYMGINRDTARKEAYVELENSRDEIERQKDELLVVNEELRKLNLSLEDKVKERTAEIEKKTKEEQKLNEKLQTAYEKVQELREIEEKLNQELRIQEVLQTSEDVGAQILHENKNLLQPLSTLVSRARRLKKKSKELVDVIKSGGGTPADIKTTEFLIDALDRSLEMADYAYRQIMKGYEDFRQVYNPREEGKKDINRDLEACTNLMFDRNYMSFIEVKKEFSQIKVPSIYDSRQFNRGVFMDILKNARDAIVEQKSRAGKDYEGRLLVRSETKNEKTIISVYDNGIGVPEGYEEKMFQKKETTKASGTGLGLFTARFILEEKKCGKIHYKRSELPEYSTKIIVELDLI